MAKRATKKPAPRRGNQRPQAPFPNKLVLNQWLLSLFNVTRLEDLAEHLRNEAQEGLDENNIHRFHHSLTAQLFNLTELSTELLLEYDQNIVKHTLRLNERRLAHGEEPIAWKYFQYLALLATEIYLDRYFRDPAALARELNAQIAKFNLGQPEADRVAPLDLAAEAWPQLNKLAFWMATGSGKTLVMHANILQYRHYLEKHGRARELNRILLLTPNEGLSQQHLREFEQAGIHAAIFEKERHGLFTERPVEIIEVTKLVDQAQENARKLGEKSLAIDAFEGNNLVLVDEGHRGASGGEEGAWLKARNALCERGFSFEYSATFQQAVAGKPKLADLYAKNILFNYSYRYFYEDGFGKEHQILNLDEATQAGHLELYLVACLLTFFQQQRLFREHAAAFRPFNLEKPLWIFVGGSVTKTLAARDASDIIEILKFLARYVADRPGSIARIDRVLNQGLETAARKNLFAGRFTHLNTSGLSAAQVFEETLATVFNAPAGGQLYVENLKGATGEVALRLGADNEPFGVINVGEDAKLVNRCGEHGLATGEREFAGSLFHDINRPGSTVNVLVGSKKFTEGWSSWRVSTMGLMNVGRSEGAQIIQLFGRGVRLKGFGMSLKRSGRAQLPDDIERPKQIAPLETLGIFGIRADYMANFREFLKEEVPDKEERIEFLLPVIKALGTQKLKTIRLKKTIDGVSTEFGDAFRRLGPMATLMTPEAAGDKARDYLQKNQVVLNWYPKIAAMKSAGVAGGDAEAAHHSATLSAAHLALVDVDRLWFELERFKAERGWFNLNVTRGAVADLLADQTWYRLLIPPEELAFDSFEKVRLWGEIALALVKKYTEHYYTYRKREWELPHLEYQDLLPTDPNLLGVGEAPGDAYYRILIDKSQEEIVAKLTELRAAIERGELKPFEFRSLKAIWFGQHLYQPLLHMRDKIVEITPVALNKGERRFIEDLTAFHEISQGGGGGFFDGRELYVLRNLSKGRGVGFFEAGNFHPDFILWLLVGRGVLKKGDRHLAESFPGENASGGSEPVPDFQQAEMQHVIFVDPKGIRQLGASDPKIRFYETIKEIEQRLGDTSVRLHSFIVSSTPSFTMRALWGLDKAAMTERHILFQEEDAGSYVRDMLARALVTFKPDSTCL